MKLAELEPRFMRHSIEPAPNYVGRPGADGVMQWGGWPQSTFSTVKSIADADRVSFLCPACFVANDGRVGTHRIMIDFAGRGTPDEACIHNSEGQPVRWGFSGTCLEDLSLAPSIQLIGGCNWHGFIENGGVRHA